MLLSLSLILKTIKRFYLKIIFLINDYQKCALSERFAPIQKKQEMKKNGRKILGFLNTSLCVT